ncbi:RNA methyltransferase [Oscillatoria sp. FACHB-1406]|uniref:TrmH family RNA methyltransferase n=1 Tax=Oscillatoria sp. FACHB-1406 TaxID=2692846 RepID=UPI0016898A45|nr:RNA methyltransferase [Oscillatoria sp. FACHB-1406]MBD2580529.1 RNA methyltransferase [Oscillatoria sp. FACHB-1406]
MLTSLQNPLVKQLRKLRSRSERHKQGLFLLEGTNALQGAGETNAPLEVLCATPDWMAKHPQLWEQLQHLAQRVETISPEVCGAIATTVNPDGVVAAAERGKLTKAPQFPLNFGIALERLQDPGNLGTIIRTAAAAEVEGLWLSEDSVDLENPKVLRASAGEWFRAPIAVSSDLAGVIADCRGGGMQIVATTPSAQFTYWEADFKKPTLILLGNEAAGLSSELLGLCDFQVKIPLGAGVESLNVAIAAALLLYEVRRQQRALREFDKA